MVSLCCEKSLFGRETALFICVVLLLGVQAGLLGYSATQHSPTHLEPVFLASGVSNWELGRYELYRVNPPLVRMIAAAPVVALGCQTDWSAFSSEPGSRSEFAVGDDFLKANGPNSLTLVIYARLACIPFSLIGAYYAYRWSSALYGVAAGMLTLVVFVFEPNLLAHGELITPDTACTAFGIMAGFYFWSWLRQPGWGRALFAGIALGLAVSSKTTWLILFGLWPLLWVFWRWEGWRATRTGAAMPGDVLPAGAAGPSSLVRPAATQLIFVLGVAIYLVNCFYSFDGTLTPVRDLTFVSRLFTGNSTSRIPGNRLEQSVAGLLPIPVPVQFLLGLDAQIADFEQYSGRSYLRGEWKRGGWWHYYLYGLLVKVPCGTIALLLLAVIWPRSTIRQQASFRDEVVLLAPALAVIVVVSSQTAFNIHLRYVFPALGLLLVFLGRTLSGSLPRFRLIRVVPILLALYSVSATLGVYPHQLSYFNEFAGGPANGHRHLLGSSLDWGQDWIVLMDPEFDESRCDQAVLVTGYSAFWQHCCFRQVTRSERSVVLSSIDDFVSSPGSDLRELPEKRWLLPCVFVERDGRPSRKRKVSSPSPVLKG